MIEDSNSCWSLSQFEKLRKIHSSVAEPFERDDVLLLKNELDFALLLHTTLSSGKSAAKQRVRWSSFYGKEDCAIAIQLSARKASGEFFSSATAASLLENVLSEKLNSSSSVDKESLLGWYQEFLAESNSFDQSDLFSQLKQLVTDKELKKFPGIRFDANVKNDGASVLLPADILNHDIVKCSTNGSSDRDFCDELNSLERNVLSLYLSFLQVLMNNRDTTATARALLTDSHGAFTALRKVSENIQLSLCQTAVSFVVRHNLGGAKTVDSRYKSLVEFRPVFASFVETLHSLQSILEEYPDDTLDCFRRLIRILRKRLLAYSASGLFQSAVSKVGEKLMESAMVSDGNLKLSRRFELVQSPAQDSSSGGSLVGRNMLRLIQRVVQRETAGMTYAMDTLGQGEVATPNQTFRIPSLLEFFSTPAVVEQESSSPSGLNSSQLTDRTPLATRNQQTQPPIRLASFLNDDSPLEASSLKQAPLDVTEDPTGNKENVPPGMEKPTRDLPAVTPKRGSIGTKVRRGSLSRTDGEKIVRMNSMEVGKKKKQTKKSAAIEKGQTKMTAFFSRA